MLKPEMRLKALPLVASMLGDKLGVKVVFGEQDTACTDGQTVFLPSLPMEEDEQLYRLVSGYIDHEAAHIRHTDFDAMKAAKLSPVAHHIFNVIEDWRVEHELVKRYPGCREHFDWLNRHLYLPKSKRKKKKAGGEKPPAFFILDYILNTVNQADVPELEEARRSAGRSIDKNWPKLRVKIDATLEQIPMRCLSTRDSIEVALELMTILEAEAQNQTTKQAQNQSVSSSEATQDGVENQSSSESSNGLSEGENNPSQRGENADLTADSSLVDLLSAAEDSLPQSSEIKLKQAIFGKNPNRKKDGFFMAAEHELVADRLSPEVVSEAHSSSRALKTRFQGLLQTRFLRRVTPARHGKTSGRLLHRIVTKNPRLFRKADEALGIDTAIHILLDRSGSMDNQIQLASQACFSVASSLYGIKGVNVAVTAFPSDLGTGDLRSVAPIFRHGERITDKFAVGAEGRTPLSEALWWTTKELFKQKEQRKIILIISDGLPDDPPIALKTLSVIRDLGIEMAGIAIDSWQLANFINAQENITDIRELAPAMFRILQQLLLKKEK
ncbi:MAG: VWA domain-containing protein [Mailhella sp.]|nr:VWA domain-containing protein [Mailhella sp.]